MRPRSLDEFIGQEHIVGPGRLLRRAIQRDQLSSIILSGPPGTGKTTLARIIANTTKSAFIALNAVLSGVGELREAIDKAKTHIELYSRKTILFVDEVHRWNKSQQDALLPWVENGTFVLIGATTENPFFEVNRALVSRSRVFLLRSLDNQDLFAVAKMTLSDRERGYGAYGVSFEPGALEHLVATADGDARSLLNALELAVETSVDSWPPPEGSPIRVSVEVAEESIQKKVVLYDKDGDYHYDTISAFIKSLRGSDPDAALYWLARMVYAGEDPDFILRRMLISAAEDVGLADPGAVQVVHSCAQAYDRIGLPEGQFHLSLAALYLATCPKSNSTLGYFDALKAVEAEGAEVPNHLKDASRDSAGFGHGMGYKYPHAYTDHWIAQQYLPSSMAKNQFYVPGELGLEGERRTLVLNRRESQLAIKIEDVEENQASVWSKEGESRKKWMSRAEASISSRLSLARTWFFDALAIRPTDRVLLIDSRKGFYCLESIRRAREGYTAVLVENREAKEQLEAMTSSLSDLAKPEIAVAEDLNPGNWISKAFGDKEFDHLVICEARPGSFGLPFLPSALGQGQMSVHFIDFLGLPSSLLSGLLRLNVPNPDETDSHALVELESFEREKKMSLLMDLPEGAWDLDMLKRFCASAVPELGEAHTLSAILEYRREVDKDLIKRRLGREAKALKHVAQLSAMAEKLPLASRWPLHVATLRYQRGR
jgi:putative ATPase